LIQISSVNNALRITDSIRKYLHNHAYRREISQATFYIDSVFEDVRRYEWNEAVIMLPHMLCICIKNESEISNFIGNNKDIDDK